MAAEVCTCGHDKGEHKPSKYTSKMIVSAGTCSGSVFAYPIDADSHTQAREVYCHCTSFMQADKEQLKEWGIDG